MKLKGFRVQQLGEQGSKIEAAESKKLSNAIALLFDLVPGSGSGVSKLQCEGVGQVHYITKMSTKTRNPYMPCIPQYHSAESRLTLP